jgi:hypothetical protein
MRSTSPTNPQAPPPDDLQHLAALAHYQEEPPPIAPDTSQGLLDPEDFVPDPATQPPLWSNPWAKAAFVGTGLGLAIALVALFLHSVHPPTSEKSPQAAPPPAPAATSTSPPSPDGDQAKSAGSRRWKSWAPRPRR